MVKWISEGKNKLGIQYREHETVTTGVGRHKRFLRYYKAVFKVNGKTISDVYGWENNFKGGISEIESLALQFKINRKMQTPPFTYREYLADRHAELLKIEEAKQAEIESQKLAEQAKFDIVFEQYCIAYEEKASIDTEKWYYNKWIKSEIGDIQLDQIQLLNLERIAKRMRKDGKKPRTIAYIKSIVRQVFNYAIKRKLFSGELPTRFFLENVVINNKRKRYLSPEEAELLLNKLRSVSEKIYQMTMVSMYTGMRFGEIAALKWQHIKMRENGIDILDPKNEEDRNVFMNEDVQDLFNSMERGKPNEYVFPNNKGTRMCKISNTFPRCVDSLGFNEGITDDRMRVVFHTMRHSCASWLAEEGTDIRVIGRILGHKTIAMTMRYSHISDAAVKGAMQTLNGRVGKKEDSKVLPIFGN